MQSFHSLFVLSSFLTIFWCNHIESRLINERIIGGNVATSDQFKYQVSLQTKGFHICGGSIIGDKHILTAAHCILDQRNNFKNAHFTIVAGVIEALSSSRSVIRVMVKKAFVPKEFVSINPNIHDSSYRDTGDIAVLELVRKLGLEKKRALISALQLPTSDFDTEKTTQPAIISGFGYEGIKIEKDPLTKELKGVPTIANYRLKYAITAIISNQECQTVHSRMLYPSHFCAKVVQTNKKPEGVCHGDSGGPLVVDGTTLIGVLSYGPKFCDESILPTVYTKVSTFITFIENAKNNVDSNDIRTHTYI